MGVRISDDKHVCLYDSTTGKAFGPVFGSVGDAEEFIEYAFGRGIDDLRMIGPRKMKRTHDAWVKENDPG
jgi:hypothetical protein